MTCSHMDERDAALASARAANEALIAARAQLAMARSTPDAEIDKWKREAAKWKNWTWRWAGATLGLVIATILRAIFK